jgi:hypothetical protein
MMIDFAAVVSHFWPKALGAILDSRDVEYDQKALKALEDKSCQTRQDDLRKWLKSYAVFQGVKAAKQDQIAEAVCVWADDRNPSRNLTTPEALADAHADLMEAICRAYGNKRDFTSLTSKALWLCYPESVPIFDRNTRYALCVISKIEDGITPIAGERPKYEQFVHVWKQLYTKYKGTIEGLGMDGYRYRVRVFDRVLWLVGQPSYHTD